MVRNQRERNKSSEYVLEKGKEEEEEGNSEGRWTKKKGRKEERG